MIFYLITNNNFIDIIKDYRFYENYFLNVDAEFKMHHIE